MAWWLENASRMQKLKSQLGSWTTPPPPKKNKKQNFLLYVLAQFFCASKYWTVIENVVLLGHTNNVWHGIFFYWCQWCGCFVVECIIGIQYDITLAWSRKHGGFFFFKLLDFKFSWLFVSLMIAESLLQMCLWVLWQKQKAGRNDQMCWELQYSSFECSTEVW